MLLQWRMPPGLRNFCVPATFVIEAGEPMFMVQSKEVPCAVPPAFSRSLLLQNHFGATHMRVVPGPLDWTDLQTAMAKRDCPLAGVMYSRRGLVLACTSAHHLLSRWWLCSGARTGPSRRGRLVLTLTLDWPG